MFTSKATDDYDKIMLSFKEKRILRHILKEGKVPYNYCNDSQRELFLKYDLVSIHRKQIATETGRVTFDPNAPVYIAANDKAKRYFLYRKENYFKGKLPVVIALVALIKSFDVEICWLAHFILSLLSNL